MKDVSLQIIELLRQELPQVLLYNVDEIETLIISEKYRAAYLKMDQLKKEQVWSPTKEYLHLMEEFWWNYAN